MNHHPRCDWIRCHVDCKHWTPPTDGCEDCHRYGKVIDTCRRSMKFTTEGTVGMALAQAKAKLAEHRQQVHGDAEAVAS